MLTANAAAVILKAAMIHASSTLHDAKVKDYTTIGHVTLEH